MACWHSYQTMVEEAYQMGGPDIYKQGLVNIGIEIGRKSMQPLIVTCIAGGIAVGTLCTLGVIELINYFADRKPREKENEYKLTKGADNKLGKKTFFKEHLRYKL